MKCSLSRLEKRIGIAFREKNLLQQALTHRSYAHEQSVHSIQDNEVLEFLGDAVIGLVTAHFFIALKTGASEGDLSKLKSSAASAAALAQLARRIKLQNHLLLGKGEERSGGRKKPTILAGAFEALCGAIYLDQGYEAAREFLWKILSEKFSAKREDLELENAKSTLQEYLQKQGFPLPEYRTVLSSGPDHAKKFVVEVRAGANVCVKACGRSIKGAEQRAARKALQRLLESGSDQ